MRRKYDRNGSCLFARRALRIARGAGEGEERGVHEWAVSLVESGLFLGSSEHFSFPTFCLMKIAEKERGSKAYPESEGPYTIVYPNS